jgi:hypothetical protein
MMRQARNLIIIATAVIAAMGAILFFVSVSMGELVVAKGIACGAGIAALEFDSTAVVLAILLRRPSKGFWGVLLATKSLTVLGLVGALIWVLKISAIGFIIGFSGLILAIGIGAAYSMAGAKEVK